MHSATLRTARSSVEQHDAIVAVYNLETEGLINVQRLARFWVVNRAGEAKRFLARALSLIGKDGIFANILAGFRDNPSDRHDGATAG